MPEAMLPLSCPSQFAEERLYILFKKYIVSNKLTQLEDVKTKSNEQVFSFL
jgi:hypothetical protein